MSLDLVGEADELLMPVLLHAGPDDLAFEDVEGCEEGGGAVALVVVGLPASAAHCDTTPASSDADDRRVEIPVRMRQIRTH
jgi:hypothetical protein